MLRPLKSRPVARCVHKALFVFRLFSDGRYAADALLRKRVNTGLVLFFCSCCVPLFTPSNFKLSNTAGMRLSLPLDSRKAFWVSKVLAGRRPVSCGTSLISIWIFGWQCERGQSSSEISRKPAFFFSHVLVTTATLKPNFFRLLVHAVYRFSEEFFFIDATLDLMSVCSQKPVERRPLKV